MARLRKANIDPFKSREAMAVHLKKIETQGDRGIGTPTPERALRANGSMRQGADKVMRLEDAPLDRLAARGQLHPRDPRLNRIYKEAGEEYYRDYMLSGMSQLKAMDPSRIVIDGGAIGSSGGLPATLAAEFHRKRFFAAQRYIGTEFSPIVDAVVLREEPLIDVGRRISGHASNNSATAVAMDRLSLGLSRAAVHYGLMDT